jgi:hypothetical protein
MTDSRESPGSRLASGHIEWASLLTVAQKLLTMKALSLDHVGASVSLKCAVFLKWRRSMGVHRCFRFRQFLGIVDKEAEHRSSWPIVARSEFVKMVEVATKETVQDKDGSFDRMASSLHEQVR